MKALVLTIPNISELFGRASFLMGVIVAQSQQRAEKVGVSPKIGDVKKKTRPQFLEFLRILASDPKKIFFREAFNFAGMFQL